MAREEDCVGGEVELIGVAEARSALAWWLEAGVDIAIQEQPRDWLKPAPPRAAPASDPAAVSNVAEPDSETLAALQSWLASSAQVPLASVSSKRILPHGPENAPVMLLSDGPTLEDAAAGQPIGGESWALATRMLAAIGIAADQAYSASLSCFHAPGTQDDRQGPGSLRRNRPAAHPSGQAAALAALRRRRHAARCSEKR